MIDARVLGRCMRGSVIAGGGDQVFPLSTATCTCGSRGTATSVGDREAEHHFKSATQRRHPPFSPGEDDAKAVLFAPFQGDRRLPERPPCLLRVSSWGMRTLPRCRVARQSSPPGKPSGLSNQRISVAGLMDRAPIEKCIPSV